MVLIIYAFLDRFRRTFRESFLLELETVPSVMPEIQKFLCRIHEEIAVVVLAPGGITVVPLAVYLYVIPEVCGCLVRVAFDRHVLDTGHIEERPHSAGG